MEGECEEKTYRVRGVIILVALAYGLFVERNGGLVLVETLLSLAGACVVAAKCPTLPWAI